MVSQNYILIGLQSFIGRLMEYLHVMVFCLITRSRRGETFVTRKITMFLAKKFLGSKEVLKLGNINAKEIGDMQKIMLNYSGKCYKKKHLQIM